MGVCGRGGVGVSVEFLRIHADNIPGIEPQGGQWQTPPPWTASCELSTTAGTPWIAERGAEGMALAVPPRKRPVNPQAVVTKLTPHALPSAMTMVTEGRRERQIRCKKRMTTPEIGKKDVREIFEQNGDFRGRGR